MSQLTYDRAFAVAFPGMKVDSSRSDDCVSRYNAEASAALPFGIIVAKAATDTGVFLMVDASSVLAGVSVHEHSVDQNTLPSSPAAAGVAAKGELAVMRRGRLWCLTEEAVTPASPVFVRFAAGAGGTQLGALRASADTASAVAAGSAFKFVSTAAAGALVQVEVSLS